MDAHLPHLAACANGRERDFVLLCERHGLPIPEPNTRIGRYRPDMLWPDRRLIVEIDGRRAHSTPAQLAADGRRQERLERLGYRVTRFAAARTSELASGSRPSCGRSSPSPAPSATSAAPSPASARRSPRSRWSRSRRRSPSSRSPGRWERRARPTRSGARRAAPGRRRATARPDRRRGTRGRRADDRRGGANPAVEVEAAADRRRTGEQQPPQLVGDGAFGDRPGARREADADAEDRAGPVAGDADRPAVPVGGDQDPHERERARDPPVRPAARADRRRDRVVEEGPGEDAGGRPHLAVAIGPISNEASGPSQRRPAAGPRSTGRAGVDRDRREVGDRGRDDEHVEDLVVAEDRRARVGTLLRVDDRADRVEDPAGGDQDAGADPGVGDDRGEARSRRSSRRSDIRRPRPSAARSPRRARRGSRRGLRPRPRSGAPSPSGAADDERTGTGVTVPAISRKIIEWSRRRIHIRDGRPLPVDPVVEGARAEQGRERDRVDREREALARPRRRRRAAPAGDERDGEGVLVETPRSFGLTFVVALDRGGLRRRAIDPLAPSRARSACLDGRSRSLAHALDGAASAVAIRSARARPLASSSPSAVVITTRDLTTPGKLRASATRSCAHAISRCRRGTLPVVESGRANVRNATPTRVLESRRPRTGRGAPAPRVLGVRPSLHHLRAPRADRRYVPQARRRAPALRPRQAARGARARRPQAPVATA